MPILTTVRCIRLSSPCADADGPEIKECFPNGPKRTIGLVEVAFDNGVTGLDKGYFAVFAPPMFKSIVDPCTPLVMGKDGFDIDRRVKDLRSQCDHWSLQGAARQAAPPPRPPAEKACDAGNLRARFLATGIETVIPSTSDRKTPISP